MATEDTYTGEDYKPGKLVPITSPVDLKEATVRDYKRTHERMGVKLDSSLLERLAVSDLELVDAHRRGIDCSPNYKRKEPPKKRKAAESAVAVPDLENGLKLKLKPRTKKLAGPRGWLDMPGNQIDEKWTFMMGRLKRISEGASATPDMLASLSTTEMPKLALRLRRAMSDYMLRHRISKHNPYMMMSGRILGSKDAFRKFRRELEDICDASSGHLGPWWVPK